LLHFLRVFRFIDFDLRNLLYFPGGGTLMMSLVSGGLLEAVGGRGGAL
jgi:hypothetical protein